MRDMRRQMISLDLTLGFDGGGVLQCHRVVLAAASTFFRSFFASNSVTALTSSPAPKIQIENAKMHIFDRLLDYAYTGRIDVSR